MHHRAFLTFSLLPLLALVGCSSDDEAPAPTGPTVLPGPAEWNKEVTPPSDEEAAATRAACGYKASALPAETQGASYPNGADIPIDHVLVMMMENRSFDHYFQKLPEYGQPDVDVAPSDFTNPDVDGNPVGIFRDTQYCFVDTAHSWNASHLQVNDGAMDGFFATNDGNHELPVGGTLEMLSGRRALGYHTQEDIPFYYWLANTFSIADRYFCSVQGPTLVNRMYLYASSSFGQIRNVIEAERTTLPDYMQLRELDWKIYSSTTPGFGAFVDDMIAYTGDHLSTIDQFFADAEAGTLPQMAFIDPSLAREAWDSDDEHPPAMAQYGERLVARVVDALTRSPSWSRSALFITYDEHGGQYDHVAPPSACPPDDHAPKIEPGDVPGAFDQLGVRVPMMVVSPYAKKHHVSHEVYDHTSISRFIQARFVMPALSNRDANALAPWDMFDFENPPFLEPPAITIPEVPAAAATTCKSIFDG